MRLAAIVRSAVAIADKVTKDLQPVVLHSAWVSNDAYGAPVYDSEVSRPALVEWKQKLVKTSSGQELTSRATVTFLVPVPANGAAGRQEPIDPRDILVLPDGSTGPILDISGFLNKETGKPFLSEVWIG